MKNDPFQWHGDRPAYMIDHSLDALKALRAMIEVVADASPENHMEGHGFGLGFLMQVHLLNIENQVAALGDEYHRLTAEARQAAEDAKGRPVWHDLDAIATKACVHKGDVARVLFVLTGEDHAGADYKADAGNPSDGLPAHLLSMLINRTLAHGDIWGQVSTATGIDLMDVKRILEAMLAYIPGKTAISLEDEFVVPPMFNAAMLEAVPPEPATIRDELIAEKLREGVTAQTIAQAMNLRRSVVDRVAAKLEGRADPNVEEPKSATA